MAAILQAAINNTQSERLKEVLDMTPQFLAQYFSIALRDVNDCMFFLFPNHICAQCHNRIVVDYLWFTFYFLHRLCSITLRINSFGYVKVCCNIP